MKRDLERIKFRMANLDFYKANCFVMSFDLCTLKGLINKCKNKNLKQEMCNCYNELFVLREKIEKELFG